MRYTLNLNTMSVVIFPVVYLLSTGCLVSQMVSKFTVSAFRLLSAFALRVKSHHPVLE